METLKTELNPSSLDFNIDDCHKVINIYIASKKKKVSKTIDMQEMLYLIRLAFGVYKIAQYQDEAPTITQLRKQHTDIRNKAQNLLKDLQEKTDTYFLNSLVASMNGKRTTLNIDDNEYKTLMLDIYEKLENLGSSLKWLTDNLSPCTTDNFNYIHTKLNPKTRMSARNRFISDLALILTEHLGKGGYRYDQYKNDCYGWKADSIKYLLNRVNIECTKMQIFAVLNASPIHKDADNTSK